MPLPKVFKVRSGKVHIYIYIQYSWCQLGITVSWSPWPIQRPRFRHTRPCTYGCSYCKHPLTSTVMCTRSCPFESMSVEISNLYYQPCHLGNLWLIPLVIDDPTICTPLHTLMKSATAPWTAEQGTYTCLFPHLVCYLESVGRMPKL